MADFQSKTPHNVPGAFYVDQSCIDCDMCRANVPDIFRRSDDTGFTYVHRQPQTDDDYQRAEVALDDCPTGSIGKDGALTPSGRE